MAEETQIKTPSLPPDYVSITVLRERWLQRQNAKKQEEEAKKEMKCEEGCVDGKKDGVDDCVKGKGKKVVESGGGEKRGRNVEFCGSEGSLYRDGEGMKMNVGLRGFRDWRINKGDGRYGGDWRKERIEVGNEEVVKGGNVVDGWKDYGNRWIYEGEGVGGDGRGFGKGLGDGKGENEVRKRNVVDIGGKFRDLEISGGKKGGGKYGGSRECEGFGKGENGHVKRYLVDVREGNVVDVKLLEDLGETRVNDEVEIGGKFMDLLRNGRRGGGKYGRDSCKFGKVLGVGKGENVVEKKRNVVDVSAGSEVFKGNVVDVREENVVDGKMLEVSKGNGDRRINEVVDMGMKFGDLKINGGGKRGKLRYGRERPRFGPMKEKILVAVRKENEAEEPISVAVRKEDEVEKPIAVAVRRENEAEKRNLVDVKEQNDVEKQIPVAVRDGNEVKKQNLVDVKMAESSKSFGHRRGNDAVRRENEVEKRNLVDVKEKNDVEKQIPVAVRDGNEVKKRNLVDVKIAESSKGFGHWRGNEAIRGKFGGLSNNGWRKGNGKYGRGRGRFGSWNNKQEESGMMWVKKADAEADTQAQAETADVK